MIFKNKTKNYHVSLDNEDWVAPEETLLDSQSGYSDIEQPISPGVFRFLFIAASAFLLLVLGAVVKLSWLKHDVYAQLALQNKSLNLYVAPPRGIIFDRYGTPLVENVPAFGLAVLSQELFSNQKKAREESDAVAKILNVGEEDFWKLLTDNAKENAIFFAALDLAKDQILKVRYLNPKGFYVIVETKRNYVDGPALAHVLGYVSKVTKADLEDSYYYPTDTIGRSGIESQYEAMLRGEHGRLLFDTQDSGEKITATEAIPGKNLALSIDEELQKKVYTEVDKALRQAGLTRGAAVVQNPQTGEVLALASFPSYDDNIFNGLVSREEYTSLFENKLRPLFNRTISGLYNPGSTIKPLMGLMTLQEKIFTPQDTIPDCNSITFPNLFHPDQPYVFNNWRSESGPFNLRRAIANSCNIYFFTAGGGFGDIQGLGITRIAKYLKAAFADIKLGIDLPSEEKGFVPTPEWKQKTRKESWYTGDTYNTSIGQGDLLVTPLWLNGYISAIANGGTMYMPRVVQKVVDANKNTITDFPSQAIGTLPFSKENINEIKRNMRETVLSGTAQSLQDIPVEIAAKTGTAEVIKGERVNALFVTFAPLANPEIAMTILIEGATSNEGIAIRIAHEIYRWYFSRDRSALEPVQ